MKKEWILPLLIGLLLFFVGTLSFLLIFFKANPQLLRHKIKLGLIIISLQAMLSGCGSMVQTGDEISCYAKPIEPDVMSLVNSNYKDGKYIYHKSTDTIRVNVSDRSSTNFSFILCNEAGRVSAKGDLISKDGKLEKAWEELFVPLPTGIDAGDYQLVFYNRSISTSVVDSNRRASYAIIIE